MVAVVTVYCSRVGTMKLLYNSNADSSVLTADRNKCK